MGIKTQKVLRFISKTVLLVVGLVLIGYVGLVVYKSIVNKPQKVRVTNVTNSAATITWVTDNPVRGVVYYNTKDSVLPGPLGFLFSNVGYDDRDFALAQKDCVDAFNENAKNTKDENFAVSGENFDCENIRVEKLGAYYTHSVTLKNLDESGIYFFKVGNGILSWGINGVGKDINENDLPLATKFELSTGIVPTTIPTPNIAYGNVVAKLKYSEGEGEAYYEDLSKDSLVFSYLEINDQKSQIISSVTNSSGGWILDKSNFRDTEGNLITDLSKATMRVCAQYEDVGTRGCVEALGDLTEDTELELMGNKESDLTDVEKSRILEKFEKLIGKVYAISGPFPVCKSTPCSDGGATYTSCSSSGASGCAKPFSSSVGKCTGKKDGYNIEKWFSLVDWSNDLPSWCSSGSTNEAICAGKVVSIDDICSQANPSGCSAPAGAGAGHAQKIRDKIASCNTDECQVDDDCGGDEVCTSHQCVSDGSDDVFCNDAGTQVIEGGYCPSNNRRCSHSGRCDGAVNGGGGNVVTIGGDCSPENSEGTANSVPVICLGGTWRKLVRCIDSNGVPYKENSCHYIVYGTSSEKCIAKASSPYWQWQQYPNAAKCDLPNPEEKCTLTPTYSTEFDTSCMGDKCLLSCTLTCKDGSKILGATECHKLAPSIAISIASTDANYSADITTVPLDFSSMNATDLGLLADVDPDVRPGLNQRMNMLIAEVNAWKCGDTNNVTSQSSEAKNLCKALDGKWNAEWPACDGNLIAFDPNISCSDVVLGNNNDGYKLVSKVYAQDNEADGYTLYLPEYGMFSFQLGNYDLQTEVNDGNTYYIFYIESNGVNGFQMPADPDNPTTAEDVILRSNSAAIKYEKVSSAQKYAIVKGINLISFDFVPVSTELGAYTAADVISQATKNGVTIQYISTFDGGRWNNGYSCTSTPCTGNNFTIVPGKGYLIYATKAGEVTIPGYNLTSSVPIPFSAGWNLVGVHGYTTAYTARSFIDSINKVEGLTANNVSWWPTSKSKYEGLQVDNGTEYGLDFPISPDNGYFVRISKFAPTDAKCKSIIWQAANGKLSGTCGNTK